jgi:hypothetical protein
MLFVTRRKQLGRAYYEGLENDDFYEFIGALIDFFLPTIPVKSLPTSGILSLKAKINVRTKRLALYLCMFEMKT